MCFDLVKYKTKCPMPHKEEDLLFLKEKIENIRVAFFKLESEIGLQLPNNIISTQQVTKDGHIWFYTSCLGDYTQFMGDDLHVYLNYYSKGICLLQIRGKASIIKEDQNLL